MRIMGQGTYVVVMGRRHTYYNNKERYRKGNTTQQPKGQRRETGDGRQETGDGRRETGDGTKKMEHSIPITHRIHSNKIRTNFFNIIQQIKNKSATKS